MLTNQQQRTLGKLIAKVKEFIIRYEGARWSALAMKDFEETFARTPEADRIKLCRRYIRLYQNKVAPHV